MTWPSRRRRALFALGVALGAILGLVVRAGQAQTTGTGSGYLGGGNLGVGLNTGSPGGSGGGGGGSGGGGGGGGGVATCTPFGGGPAGPVRWQAVPAFLSDQLSAATPHDGDGAWYVQYCGNNMARPMGSFCTACVWLPRGTGGAPEPPPPPPTADEMRRAIPLPEPRFGISPDGDLLTGLPTWLWDPGGVDTASVTVNIRGYTATATATTSRWEWTMRSPGDPVGRNPAPTVTSNRPGSEASPAATYTYETVGTYTQRLRVVWEGTFSYTGPASSASSPLGSASRETTRTALVAELRPVHEGDAR